MPKRESRPQRLNILLQKESPEDRLEYLLSQPDQIKNIEQHALGLLKLNAVVKKLLSPPLQPWCRVANYRQNILVLDIANGSWMMRLRYEQLNLLSALRKQILPSLCSIHIRINPILMLEFHNTKQKLEGMKTKETDESNSRCLSLKTAELLVNLASRSPKKLSDALKRLAGLVKNSTSPPPI